jgi:hypothetical protein
MSKDVAADIPVAEAPAKRAPLNKYALACAILASMNSILLGYGSCTSLSDSCTYANYWILFGSML